jgi:hypothetical protein
MTNGVRAPAGLIVDIDPKGIWVASTDEQFLVVTQLGRGGRLRDFQRWARHHGVRIGEKFE